MLYKLEVRLVLYNFLIFPLIPLFFFFSCLINSMAILSETGNIFLVSCIHSCHLPGKASPAKILSLKADGSIFHMKQTAHWNIPKECCYIPTQSPCGMPRCLPQHQPPPVINLMFDKHCIFWVPTPCKLISKYDDLLKHSKPPFEIKYVGHKAPWNSQEIIPALVCVLGKFAQWSKSVITAWKNTQFYEHSQF